MGYDERIIDIAKIAAEAAGKNARVAPQLLSADIIFTLADAVEDGRLVLGPAAKDAPSASPADARALIAVCSNTRRASTQSMKGNQWWARDVYHLLGDNKRTLCGRDCADWLTIGPMPTLDDNCCKRCAALSSTPTHVAGEGGPTRAGNAPVGEDLREALEKWRLKDGYTPAYIAGWNSMLDQALREIAELFAEIAKTSSPTHVAGEGK